MDYFPKQRRLTMMMKVSMWSRFPGSGLAALPVLFLAAISWSSHTSTVVDASTSVETLPKAESVSAATTLTTSSSSSTLAAARNSISSISSTSSARTSEYTNVAIHNNVLSHVASKTPLLNLEGIDLPHLKHLNGRQVFLNGAGTRAIRFMGMNFKVYVAGFYASQFEETAEAILERFDSRHNDDNDNDNDGEKGRPEECLYQMDFTFLRSVGQSKVTQAWQEQLQYSVSHKYEGYEKDRDDFIAMFGPIQNGGTETVQMVGNDTIIIDQGEYKGIIRGRDFQHAFLSVWFGEKAVAADLKAGLLGKVVLDEKNVLAVLRAAAAADSQQQPLQVAPVEDSISSSSTTTMTVVDSTTVNDSQVGDKIQDDAGASPSICDENQHELCRA